MDTVTDLIFLGSKITADGDYTHEIKRHLLLRRKVMTNLDSILKSRDIPLPTKVRIVKTMVFPVVMYGCESWTIKKAECRRTDAFQLWCWRRLLSPLDCKEIKPVNPKGNQSWILIGRAEAEAPILWQPDVKNWLTRKDPDARKDWRQEEKGTREDEMVGWHHWLDEHAFEQVLGVGDGQGGLGAIVRGVARSPTLNWWTERIGLLIPTDRYLRYLGIIRIPAGYKVLLSWRSEKEERSSLQVRKDWELPVGCVVLCWSQLW